MLRSDAYIIEFVYLCVKQPFQQNCLSIEGRSPTNRIHRHGFCSCDLHYDSISGVTRVGVTREGPPPLSDATGDPITLINELDLEI